jgi:hypothetical protein
MPITSVAGGIGGEAHRAVEEFMGGEVFETFHLVVNKPAKEPNRASNDYDSAQTPGRAKNTDCAAQYQHS